MSRHAPNPILDRLALWIGTGLGIGLATPAPGTVGGLWGLPLAYLVSLNHQPGGHTATIILLLIVGVMIATRAARVLGGSKDPQAIVIDEIVVLPIVMLGTGDFSWTKVLVGWALFRLFDITKPPPCKRAERLPEGLGIVADDAIAAVYACVALHVALWLDGALGWGYLGV